MNHLLVSAFLVGGLISQGVAPAPKGEPVELTMSLKMVAGKRSTIRYLFILEEDDVETTYSTLEGLKAELRLKPEGSTLTWSPGCMRWGGEPLLDSPEDMSAFNLFCHNIGIRFIIVPSG